MSIDYIKSKLTGTGRSTFDTAISKVLGDVDYSNYRVIEYIDCANFTICSMINKLMCNSITQIIDTKPIIVW